MSLLSWFLLKRMHLIPYIGLPNILLNKFAVPELLQEEAQPEKIARETIKILSNKKNLKDLKSDFKKLHLNLKKNTSSLIIGEVQRYLK